MTPRPPILLSARQREILQAFDDCEGNGAETARRLKLTPQRVSTVVREALRRLKHHGIQLSAEVRSADMKAATIDYTNHRGERRTRRIMPSGKVYWGATEWHPEEQWLFDAVDMDSLERRTFAMRSIHSWS